eukprot:3876611-Rhodomonas_salina.2
MGRTVGGVRRRLGILVVTLAHGVWPCDRTHASHSGCDRFPSCLASTVRMAVRLTRSSSVGAARADLGDWERMLCMRVRLGADEPTRGGLRAGGWWPATW